MTTYKDEALDAMVKELIIALRAAGADPRNPPQGRPPSARAFAEYQRRGGTVYTDPDEFTDVLVARVRDGA